MSPRPARRLVHAALVLAAAAYRTDPAALDVGIAGAAAPGGAAVELVRAAARPVSGAPGDYDPLLALVTGDTRAVLLGESTHGTHEFYRERARITRRLVTERGFTALLVEGDWPDAWRVNEYVRGMGADRTAAEALSSFARFPQWMWRNADARELVQWLREHNAARPPEQRVGFLTYTGTVFATRAWGEPGAVRDVRPALEGSFGRLFHDAGIGDFLLVLRGNAAARDELSRPRPERAIGVVYAPQTERRSHYFSARLGQQFDAVVFFDVTRAVTPLAGSRVAGAGRGASPEIGAARLDR